MYVDMGWVGWGEVGWDEGRGDGNSDERIGLDRVNIVFYWAKNTLAWSGPISECIRPNYLKKAKKLIGRSGQNWANRLHPI